MKTNSHTTSTQPVRQAAGPWPSENAPDLYGLKAWRGERLLSQAQLAERSGVDRATINRLERTNRRPQAATAAKLAHALGTDVGRLFPGEAAT